MSSKTLCIHSEDLSATVSSTPALLAPGALPPPGDLPPPWPCAAIFSFKRLLASIAFRYNSPLAPSSRNAFCFFHASCTALRVSGIGGIPLPLPCPPCPPPPNGFHPPNPCPPCPPPTSGFNPPPTCPPCPPPPSGFNPPPTCPPCPPPTNGFNHLHRPPCHPAPNGLNSSPETQPRRSLILQ